MWGFHLDLVIMSHQGFLIPISRLLTFKQSSKTPLKNVEHQLVEGAGFGGYIHMLFPGSN